MELGTNSWKDNKGDWHMMLRTGPHISCSDLQRKFVENLQMKITEKYILT